MPDIPTPIKVVIGIAVTAVDEARKLPESLPLTVTNLPVLAVSAAMQASLKVQQRLAGFAARGDEVLAQVRGTSDEPPAWATFDDPPVATDSTPLRAAFDRIDYEHTGYHGDDEPGRWDAVGAPEAGTVHTDATSTAETPLVETPVADTSPKTPADTSPETPAAETPETPAAETPDTPAAETSPETPSARTSPAAEAPTTKPPAKKSPAKKSAPRKAATKRPAVQAVPGPRAPADSPNSGPSARTAASDALADDLAQAVREFNAE
jgi:hypothetical protein